MQRKWQKRRRGYKRTFLPDPSPDNQLVIVRPESDWCFDKQSKTWRLYSDSNKYYCVATVCTKKKITILPFQ